MTAWRQIESSGVEIHYTAPQAVHQVIASLGRTEDVRFSPDNRRLAIAAFNRSRIAIFDVDIVTSAAGTNVALTAVVEIVSAALRRPHGLDFLDDETLVVANREGNLTVFKLPPGTAEGHVRDLSPIQSLRAGDAHLLKAPGSVSVSGGDRRLTELLICNNTGNQITRHVLDRADNNALATGEILLQKWLDIPDGVSVSRDRQWIAVSNHNTHCVLLYRSSPSLGPDSDPDGMLRGVHYPHGLRFSADGHHVFLADAGAPYLHVYIADEQGWRGVRYPAVSLRIMDDDLFRRGRHNPQEGGPKGLDVDGGMNVLAVTSECQPLAFFSLPVILGGASAHRQIDAGLPEPSRREAQALQLRCELEIAAQSRREQLKAQAAAARAREKLAAVKKSASWRLTRPLRWLRRALGKLG